MQHDIFDDSLPPLDVNRVMMRIVQSKAMCLQVCLWLAAQGNIHSASLPMSTLQTLCLRLLSVFLSVCTMQQNACIWNSRTNRGLDLRSNPLSTSMGYFGAGGGELTIVSTLHLAVPLGSDWLGLGLENQSNHVHVETLCA